MSDHQLTPIGHVTHTVRACWRLVRVGMHLLRGLLVVQLRFKRLDAPGRHAATGRWAAQLLQILGVGVALRGQLSAGPLMLVTNHISWLDVIALLSIEPKARFVAKAEVAGWPVIGRLVAGVGTVFVDRQRPRQAREAMAAITDELRGSGVVVVFPEGTTSRGLEVLPFRASLLQAAVTQGAAIQPLALRYAEAGHAVSPSAPYVDDDSLLRSLFATAAAPALSLHVQALPPRESAGRCRRQLAVALREEIVLALKASDDRACHAPKSHAFLTTRG